MHFKRSNELTSKNKYCSKINGNYANCYL